LKLGRPLAAVAREVILAFKPLVLVMQTYYN